MPGWIYTSDTVQTSALVCAWRSIRGIRSANISETTTIPIRADEAHTLYGEAVVRRPLSAVAVHSSQRPWAS